MRYFIHIDEDGLARAVEVAPFPTTTLKQLQDLVDGLITIVSGNVDGTPVDVVANDEGLYNEEFGVNVVGSYIAGQTIVGPVVLTKHDQHGYTVGFTAKQVDSLGLLYAWDGVPDSLREGLKV